MNGAHLRFENSQECAVTFSPVHLICCVHWITHTFVRYIQSCLDKWACTYMQLSTQHSNIQSTLTESLVYIHS